MQANRKNELTKTRKTTKRTSIKIQIRALSKFPRLVAKVRKLKPLGGWCHPPSFTTIHHLFPPAFSCAGKLTA